MNPPTDKLSILAKIPSEKGDGSTWTLPAVAEARRLRKDPPPEATVRTDPGTFAVACRGPVYVMVPADRVGPTVQLIESSGGRPTGRWLVVPVAFPSIVYTNGSATLRTAWPPVAASPGIGRKGEGR